MRRPVTRSGTIRTQMVAGPVPHRTNRCAAARTCSPRSSTCSACPTTSTLHPDRPSASKPSTSKQTFGQCSAACSFVRLFVGNTTQPLMGSTVWFTGKISGVPSTTTPSRPTVLLARRSTHSSNDNSSSHVDMTYLPCCLPRSDHGSRAVDRAEGHSPRRRSRPIRASNGTPRHPGGHMANAPRSTAAFDELLAALTEARDNYALSDERGHNELETIEAYRYILHLVSESIDLIVDTDPERPRFTCMVSPSRKYLGDNPD